MRAYSLSALSKIVNIPVRKLRYVIDHDLVPDRGWFLADDEPGTPRMLDDITATFVTSAARMLEAGYRREAVRDFLAAAEEIKPKGRNRLGLPLLASAMVTKEPTTLSAADGTHIRCVIGKRDSGWLRIGEKIKADKTFEPTVLISVDLGKIRDLLQKD